MPYAVPPPADEPLELAALRALAAEIAAGDYRDRLGHRLTNNTAYLAAVALLTAREALEQPRSARGFRQDNPGEDPDASR